MPLEDGETAIGAKLDGSFSLQIDATENASLQFAISSFNVDTGKYFIELVDLGTLGGDDYADSIHIYSLFNTDIYSIGEIVTGQIEESGDLDLIEVSLTSGQRYELVALGFNDDAGTLALPELTLLNSDGVAVATGFTDLDAGRSTIETSVFSSGDYYIQVGAKEFEGNLVSSPLGGIHDRPWPSYLIEGTWEQHTQAWELLHLKGKQILVSALTRISRTLLKKAPRCGS